MSNDDIQQIIPSLPKLKKQRSRTKIVDVSIPSFWVARFIKKKKKKKMFKLSVVSEAWSQSLIYYTLGVKAKIKDSVYVSR